MNSHLSHKTFRRFFVSPLLILAAILSLLFIRSNFGFYYLLSGSMSPAYPTGTLMITSALLNPEVGSVCAYRHNGIIVIHRITAETDDGFIFKGDANNVTDPGIVSQEDIQGCLLFAIPSLQNIFIKGDQT